MIADKLFISWSGPLGKVIAESLKDHLLDLPGIIEPWISSENIESGAPFFEEIIRAASECKFAIGCITPGATQKPWVNFEFGLLYGRLNNFKIISFGEQRSGPLAHIQAVDGNSREELLRLLVSLAPERENHASRHFERVYPIWKDIIDRALLHHGNHIRFEQSADYLRNKILEKSSTDAIIKNHSFSSIVCTSLIRLGIGIPSVENTYYASQDDYPYHLVEVQREYSAKVDAIALLQVEELFWQRNIGREIRDTAVRESRRLFVVRSEKQLEEHWETLLSHAKSYNVFVLSYDDLTRYFEDKFVKDFSIIEIKGSRVVAAYDRRTYPSTIQYLADEEIVKEHALVFTNILKQAQYINPAENPDLATVCAEVFVAKVLTPLIRRTTEMSEYIPIDEYDAHEEKHAYYQDMMKKMIKEFRDYFKSSDGNYRILELGAGTGLFTKRLAEQLHNIKELVALEIDWACYNRLLYKMMSFEHVKVFYEDSRKFNPPGKFHAIFSSFADHHIKSKDKSDYFGNVRQNLLPNGLFIVGDEFLPMHDMHNEEQRINALKMYHGHIIGLAEKAGEPILVQLEAAALKSGIDKIGDFKLACDEYEHHLLNNGFSFKKIRVGPLEDETALHIGGVYVYICQVTG